ncbi:MAG: HNH endonuclease signature motif containing protein [Bdellovibrionota bacterium]
MLTLENQKEWIEKAKSLPQRALEREVAKVRPELATPEKTKYVSENRLNLSLGISQKLLERIQRIQDLESQRTKSAASLEDALEAMAEIYLHRNDPLEKAKRAKPAQLVLRQVEFKREPIPAGVGHQVRVRDLSQCTDVKNGIRCTNRRWLEIHHLKPVSQGGSNEVDNLTTLCQAHHRIEHRLDTPRRA